jgi:hypothetical protein
MVPMWLRAERVYEGRWGHGRVRGQCGRAGRSRACQEAAPQRCPEIRADHIDIVIPSAEMARSEKPPLLLVGPRLTPTLGAGRAAVQ